ncbi:MAG: AI-2E family transporter, partial [Sphaerospermopsis kisseleviana]
GLLGTLVAVPIAGTIKGTFDAIKNNKNGNSVYSYAVVDD